MHQNPLGWEPSELAQIRTEITQYLEGLEFPKTVDAYPMIFSKLHHHTGLLFLYPPNLLHPFPSFHLLKHMKFEFLSHLRENLEKEGLEVLGKEKVLSRFPVLIRGLQSWSSFPMAEFSCSDTLDVLNSYNEGSENLRSTLFQDPFGERLNDCFLHYLEENDLLNKTYRRIDIPQDSPRISLYLNRSFSKARISGDYAFRQTQEYRGQFQWFQKQSWLKQVIFQGISTSRRAAEFFKKANDEMEKGNWSAAQTLLNQALKLEPGHEEMLIDLSIVKEKLALPTSEEIPLSPQATLFQQANDEMERENWGEARRLLKQALEIEPGHKEMLFDLKIVEEELAD